MFEWDGEKAKENLRKHRVSFDDAVLAFDDLFAIEWIDDREDYGEERCIRVAIVDGRLLHVTFTERDEITRIISAREANRHEQDLYYSQETP